MTQTDEIKNLAIKVFGDWKKASNWYYTSKLEIFGGRTPFQVVVDGEGEDVITLLNRIRHGVFT